MENYRIPINSNFESVDTSVYINDTLNLSEHISCDETSQNVCGNDFDEDNTKIKIPISLYKKLEKLGIINNVEVRLYNVGRSNYSKKLIQPWTIWLDYPELTSWDHDIIKRVLRTKEGEDRKTDYEKIIHICKERIRQLNLK